MLLTYGCLSNTFEKTFLNKYKITEMNHKNLYHIHLIFNYLDIPLRTDLTGILQNVAE
jgi:hypothetical protein